MEGQGGRVFREPEAGLKERVKGGGTRQGGQRKSVSEPCLSLSETGYVKAWYRLRTMFIVK